MKPAKTLTASTRQAGVVRPHRVTTLELFFDLVFVLTVTRLTQVLYEAPTGRALAQVVLMLGAVWWMYGGYAWLTNAVAADRDARRLLLLGGMGGYFVLALTIPRAFSGTGLAFGLAYLAIVGVHAALFTRAPLEGTVRGIVRLAPLNVGSALALVAGGALGGASQYALWGSAVALQWATALRGPGGFQVEPSHFVERHGLVLLVALGESVVAVGIGASGLPVDGGLVVAGLLGLALSACLWWLYFGHGDDARAEGALAALPPPARARAAIVAFFFCYLALLLGVVAIAAAEHAALAHPFAELGWTRAALLGGGTAVFLVADALFRRSLALGPWRLRRAAAAPALATVPLGAGVSAVAQIAALVALLAGAAAAGRAA